MKTYHKLLVVVVLITIAVLGVKGYRDYTRIGDVKRAMILRESTTLMQFIKAFRTTYQKIFIESHLEVSDKTFPLLPVASLPKIANEYVHTSHNKIVIRTVSDNPINSNNKANAQEMEALHYFRSHVGESYYFTENNNGDYFYASPIYITPLCLECHNTEKPQDNQLSAYLPSGSLEYKEGDLRGIVSFSGNHNDILEPLYREYLQTMIIYGGFALVLLSFLYFVFKGFYAKDEDYLEALHNEVDKQTKAIQLKNEEIVFQLYHDPLTNLPNRNRLIEDIKDAKVDGILLVNLDDFKEINDFYGQDIGDEVLISFASFVEIFASEHDYTAYKLHADEYALLCSGKEIYETKQDAEQFIETVKMFVVITEDDHDIDVTATLGIAVGKRHLLACADMALKKAKKERQPYILYDNSMEIKEEYEKNIEWARKLKKAIKDEQVVSYFQPIQRLATKEIEKYEALIRIIDDDGTVLYPNAFLEVSKKTKLYHHLTKTMIDLTLKQFEDSKYSFSINLSILDMLDEDTMKFILERVKNYADPSHITFEILESEGIDNYEKAYQFVQSVKRFGCQIAIDDFGSGYSNFEHILNLHVDLIKIDASLIKTIDRSENARITVETIVSFANSLGIETCAEFVHSQEVYAVLQEIGVTYVQGYYIGEPSPLL